MVICTKDELYSYDELSFVFRTEGGEKPEALMNALENTRKSQAVFFMPEQTFSVFSLFTGDNSICSIETNDVERWIKACSLSKEKKPAEHVCRKLNVLLDYLKAGNGVKPVTTDADNFSEV